MKKFLVAMVVSVWALGSTISFAEHDMHKMDDIHMQKMATLREMSGTMKMMSDKMTSGKMTPEMSLKMGRMMEEMSAMMDHMNRSAGMEAMMVECPKCKMKMTVKCDKAMMDKMGAVKCPMCKVDMKKVSKTDKSKSKMKGADSTMECEHCDMMMKMKGDKSMMDKMRPMKCPMCDMDMKKMDSGITDPNTMRMKMREMQKSMEEM